MRRLASAIGLSLSLFVVPLVGCASVPPETVELAHAIGRDVEEIHRSHRALAQLHFQGARDDVNTFIDGTYRPAFIEMTAREANLVPNISAILDRDPGRLPAYLAAFLNTVDPRIEQKRQELLVPINRQERELLAAIDSAHNQVQAANAVISGHLASIRSVHDAQSDALGMVGISNVRERIAETTASVSEQVARLNSRGVEISNSIDDAEERVRDLNAAISSAFSREGDS